MRPADFLDHGAKVVRFERDRVVESVAFSGKADMLFDYAGALGQGEYGNERRIGGMVAHADRNAEGRRESLYNAEIVVFLRRGVARYTVEQGGRRSAGSSFERRLNVPEAGNAGGKYERYAA